MPNPHKRCKTCKERHAPGKCKELQAVKVELQDLFCVITDLYESASDILSFADRALEDGAFGDNGEMGKRLARMRESIEKFNKIFRRK